MTLSEAIERIGYSATWGIWAEAPFTPDSDARIGQCQFENGGLLDEKTFFATGELCGDGIVNALSEMPEGAGEQEWIETTIEGLIEEVEKERVLYSQHW